MGRPKKIVVTDGLCGSQLEQRINELEAKNRNLCEMIEKWEAKYHKLDDAYSSTIEDNIDLQWTLAWLAVEYIKIKCKIEGRNRYD